MKAKTNLRWTQEQSPPPSRTRLAAKPAHRPRRNQFRRKRGKSLNQLRRKPDQSLNLQLRRRSLLSPGAGADRIFVSPLARRMAKQANLDLTRIKGSGPHGRIVKRTSSGP